MRKTFFITLLLGLVISTCAPLQPVPTVTPTSTLTASPTSTLTPTATSTSTPQPSATFTPAPTSLPTLPADTSIRKIKELLETNNDCALPCFWGMTPGETKLSDASHFLQAFASIDYGTHARSIASEEFFFDLQQPGYLGLHIRLVGDPNVVTFLQVSEFDSPSYHLAEFLSRNGKPDEVVLRTYQTFYPNTTDFVPFLIYMYYRTSYMLVAYGYGTGEIKGDWIDGCITESPSIQIWAGETPRSLDDAMYMMGWYDPDLIYLNIADASEGRLTVDQFYEMFKDKNKVPCFRTPLKLWPVP